MHTRTLVRPALPVPRGAISHAVVSLLTGGENRLDAVDLAGCDPLGGDAQLALTVLYELHYRGFHNVADEWEWDPGLLGLRRQLEDLFLARLREHCTGSEDVDRVVDEVVNPAEPSRLSSYIESTATWEQVKEFFAQRSIYHLKEADPHAWAIPRLSGRVKAAFVAVEFDEYGAGRAEAMHSELFAGLLAAADMCDDYFGYLDVAAPEAMATVNFMSMCGLHRELRGALIGLFAAAEISTAPSARRIVDGLDRLNAPEPCRHFYAAHIEADAVHEQVLRRDILEPAIAEEPEIAGSVVFGIEASEYLESRLSDHILGCWTQQSTSLMPAPPLA